MPRARASDPLLQSHFRVRVVRDPGFVGRDAILADSINILASAAIEGSRQEDGWASVMRVSAPSYEAEVEVIHEGNWEFAHRFIRFVNTSPITLEKAVFRRGGEFYNWMMAAIKGRAARRTMWIQVMDSAKEPAWDFFFHRALPTGMTGFEGLDAMNPEVLLQSLEVGYEYWIAAPAGARLIGAVESVPALIGRAGSVITRNIPFRIPG